MNHSFEKICQLLKEHNYKLTPQRRTIIEMFLENRDQHLSAEDVYDLVKQEAPDIGLATVYRTLEMLAQIGVLLKMDFGEGRLRYEFSEGVHHHHHLICVQCGDVSEVEEDLLDLMEAKIEEEEGFTIIDHQVKFFGMCKKCQENKI